MYRIFLLLLIPIFYANAMQIDIDLETHPECCLKTCLENFHKKGGTLICLEDDTEPFAFIKGDIVFPACSGANNRSQTLWNLLRVYEPEIKVMRPHATRYGFDPYNAAMNWHRTRHTIPEDEFFLWAGVAKSQKFGWDQFESWLVKTKVTGDELTTLWNYYTNEYYNPALPAGSKRIYIAFAQNAHVHLYRLIQTNVSLENVTVLYIPLRDMIADPLPEWQTYPQSKEAYRRLAELISLYLDFSELTAGYDQNEEALLENDIASFHP